MITYELVQYHYRVQCDRCGHQTLLSTATSEQRVKEIATRWAWVFDTENGDLCKKCARLWKVGAIRKEEEAGAARPHHRGMLWVPQR